MPIMSQKQQQVSSPFPSKIPRFDPKLYNAGTYSGNGFPYTCSSRLKKSLSHFNTKQPCEESQKRRSEPDILRSTGEKSFTDKINVSWSPHRIGFKCDGINSPKDYAAGVSGEAKLKREELSLSHLPSFLSDMEDDNASLDSLGILTPSQMKDFLEEEEEVVPEVNLVEVIDINGHKIECKLHYEDMQWSSPFLSLSGDPDQIRSAKSLLDPSNANYDEAVTPTPCNCDKADKVVQKVEYLESETTAITQSSNGASAVECGYAADNESDICVNNQQIIEMIQHASAKQDKRTLSVVPLSESGYNADNESDVLSDVSPSPTEEKYLLPETQADSIQRESVTDSGFYSETRGSCIVGSESDFDEAPHVKARNAQVIDGKLYCSQQNAEQLNENLTEANLVDSVEISSIEKSAPAFEIECERPCEEDMDETLVCDYSQIENSQLEKTLKEVVTNATVSKSSQVDNNAKKVAKTSTKTGTAIETKSKKPNVVSKLKQIIDNKSTEDLSSDAVRAKKPAASKKNRWDSITSKIAASLADEKKNPKKEVKSKIDNKGPAVPTANKAKVDSKSPVPTSSNRITKTSTKTTISLNKENVSSKPQSITRTVKKSGLSQKENRPSSARSNYSDNSKPPATSGNRKNKLARTNAVKPEKVTDQTKSPNIKSFKGSQESISSVSKPNNEQQPASRPTKRFNCSKTKKTAETKSNIVATKHPASAKKLATSTAQTKFSNSGPNTLKNKKSETNEVEIAFDQPDLIATAEYEVKVNELKNEKENLTTKNKDLQQEIEQLNSLYEEERMKFGSQLNEMKLQIKTIHIEYGEEAQKQSENVNRLYRELEVTSSNYNDLNRKSELKIEQLQIELKTLKDQQKAEEERLKERYEEKMQKIKQDQESQLLKMKDSHKLFQEIDSLKIVLDLKAEEIHSLRKQNMEMMKELESLPSTREKVRKLTAKIEDLQELLNIKSDMERSLTLEHESLKHTVETENKVNKRLSMEIEELQWKLKNTDTTDSDSLPASRPRSYCRSPAKRSSSISFFDSSPKSPSRRTFSVSICQISPSKQTQTEPFPVTFPDESHEKHPSVLANDEFTPSKLVKAKIDEVTETKSLPMCFVSGPSEDKVELDDNKIEVAETACDIKSAASHKDSSTCSSAHPHNKSSSGSMQEVSNDSELIISECLETNGTSESIVQSKILDIQNDVIVHETKNLSNSRSETTTDKDEIEAVLPKFETGSKRLDIPCSNNEPRQAADSSDSSPDDSGTYSEPTVKSVTLVVHDKTEHLKQTSDGGAISEELTSAQSSDENNKIQPLSSNLVHPSSSSSTSTSDLNTSTDNLPDHSNNSHINDFSNSGASTHASNFDCKPFLNFDLPNACSTPKIKHSSITYEIKMNSGKPVTISNEESTSSVSKIPAGHPSAGSHEAASSGCYCSCCSENSH